MTTIKLLRAAILMSVFFVGGACIASQPNSSHGQKNMIATEKLTKWMPSEGDVLWDATLTFVSDDTLALQLCHPRSSSRGNCPLLFVIQIFDRGFRTLAQRESREGAVSLFRTHSGGILAVSQGARYSQIFSADLIPKYQFPRDPSRTSLSGKTGAVYAPNDMYAIFRICAQLDCVEEVRRVKGELEAVSDDTVVTRDHDTIRVETLQGTLVSTFAVESITKCATELQIVGQGRFFLEGCGTDRIVDLHGKELARFRPPGGWGLRRRGWSADGTRLLYDQYIRTVPFLQSFAEDAIAIATLGAGAVEEKATGEEVRVVDTTTGMTCFEWKDPKHLTEEGVYHADISPSGHLVALVTWNELFVYRLPQICTEK